MLIDNTKGGFRFVKGIGPFSSGAVANPGFEIVHASAVPLIPLDDGYQVIERHLREAGRPMNAVCGMELRIPKPLSQAGFNEFNQGYLKHLAGWDVQVDASNPIARTNVAIEITPVSQPMLFGFYYTVPAIKSGVRNFVLAGAGELKSMSGGNPEVVAGTDVSTAGLTQKISFVMESLGRHLTEMGMRWDAATGVNLYTVHDAYPVMVSTILPAIGIAGHRGVTWHYTRPPITVMELEIDAHAVAREIFIAR
jgi:hypothetical protein